MGQRRTVIKGIFLKHLIPFIETYNLNGHESHTLLVALYKALEEIDAFREGEKND